MRSIPIVKSSSLDPLYKDLPVLIVSEWEEVTEDFLKSQKYRFNSKEKISEKLFIHYWINQIQDIQKKESPF
jgi:hypothetical protein